MKAGSGDLGENLHLGGERTGELSAIGRPSTGGDAGGRGVVGEELLELRQRVEGFLEIIQPEFQKRSFFDDSARFFYHFGRRRSNNGDANLADAGTEELCCCGGSRHFRSHVCNRGILQTLDPRCKFC